MNFKNKDSNDLIDQRLNSANLSTPSSDVSIISDYIKTDDANMNNIEYKTENNLDIKEVKIEKIESNVISGNSQNNATKSGIKKCPIKNCNKILRISNRFECKCGIVTCMVHRYPNNHQCPIDYKKIAKDKIAKDNPIVIADKLPERI